MRWLRFLPLTLLLGFVLFFALRPSSNPAELGWFPTWLTMGGDTADAWRNFAAFFVLTVAALLAFRPHWRVVLAGMALLVIGLEAAQNLIPDRWLEWADVLEGLAGVALAGFLYYLFRPKSDSI